MREIIFRGKRIDNGEWVFGSFMAGYIHHKTGASIVQNSVVWHEVTPETVGQFTGLLDVDGNKIFEGDVVKINDANIATVVYLSACFYTIIDSSNYRLGGWNKNVIEVIGNIYA